MTLQRTILIVTSLLLIACEEQNKPVLRGIKLPEQPVSAVVDDALQDSDLTEAGKTPLKLNLTLPEMRWDEPMLLSQPGALPDVFHQPEPESQFNWSGRLHLDESKEAQTRPITETITGAEVEFRLRLP